MRYRFNLTLIWRYLEMDAVGNRDPLFGMVYGVLADVAIAIDVYERVGETREL